MRGFTVYSLTVLFIPWSSANTKASRKVDNNLILSNEKGFLFKMLCLRTLNTNGIDNLYINDNASTLINKLTRSKLSTKPFQSTYTNQYIDPRIICAICDKDFISITTHIHQVHPISTLLKTLTQLLT